MKVFLLAFCFLANLSYSADLKKVYESDTSADTLIDEQAKEMADCLADIQWEAIKKEKERMTVREIHKEDGTVVTETVSTGEISCAWGHWPPNDHIWGAEYPTEAHCNYRDQPIVIVDEGRPTQRELPKLTEEEKQAEIDQCKQYLSELEAESVS